MPEIPSMVASYHLPTVAAHTSDYFPSVSAFPFLQNVLNFRRKWTLDTNHKIHLQLRRSGFSLRPGSRTVHRSRLAAQYLLRLLLINALVARSWCNGPIPAIISSAKYFAQACIPASLLLSPFQYLCVTLSTFNPNPAACNLDRSVPDSVLFGARSSSRQSRANEPRVFSALPTPKKAAQWRASLRVPLRRPKI